MVLGGSIGAQLKGVLKTSARSSAKVTIGWRLEGWNARRLKKGRKGLASQLPSLLSSDIKRIYKSHATPDHGLRRLF
jgi:hypothetical protein